jgi:hypothetical protein
MWRKECSLFQGEGITIAEVEVLSLEGFKWMDFSYDFIPLELARVSR